MKSCMRTDPVAFTANLKKDFMGCEINDIYVALSRQTVTLFQRQNLTLYRHYP